MIGNNIAKQMRCAATIQHKTQSHACQ